ncbi:MAG: hypothetical protein A2W90_11630 [Bacteroidetes bacterium GWF2_42_66]|nr:MAG: hypothetical protein A2W92_13640 [Bacteroidetes bacterium GWA2_42_15]OFY01778.1 MAG: hypothetical protein A2W89_22940 [Bacteroidetes bacterium GWE2_42_39]OFY44929.1 MAG: hypothetical protein A2W90_11630 [Bacteroidetes bacterium GWF2_42_66]HBL76059.1 hypothetical protein [Prolixibacteraceae bacterium]HCR89685.1 hypothetical protein [Prolixibacteraceae bacterium]
MNIYKYRGGHFKRDLASLVNNYFYASSAEYLNDPCEMLVFSDKFKLQIGFFGKLLGKQSRDKIEELNGGIDDLLLRRNEMGIYSLSETYDDELLWAHYADGHKGFCIEYDLDILLNESSFSKLRYFPVKYKMKPPQIDINDLKNNSLDFYKKVAGIKSKKWSYEKEIRIISEDVGEQDYDYRAVKAIYFGYKMPDKQKRIIMNRLKGRGLKYYQIELDEKNYTFFRKEIIDQFISSPEYLFKFYRDNRNVRILPSIIDYRIIEQRYYSSRKKGHLSIILDYKLFESELKKIGEELKNKLFRAAKIGRIFYYIKGQSTEIAWAYTHYNEENTETKVQGLIIEEEQVFINIAKSDNRDIIGQWIDDSAYISSLKTLYVSEKRYFMETLYQDKSKSCTEQIINKVPIGLKCEDKTGNKHGEYIIIDKNGILCYYSSSDLFKKIIGIRNNIKQIL